MLKLGLPPELVNMWADMYQKLLRSSKIVKNVGRPFHPTNGIDQGDTTSIIPAIALVSMQSDYLDTVAPDVKKAACRTGEVTPSVRYFFQKKSTQLAAAKEAEIANRKCVAPRLK